MRPFAAETFLDALVAREVADPLPVLPLRDAVLFPEQRLTVAVGRPATVAAIEAARRSEGRHVLVVAQREPDIDDPTARDLYGLGCVARVFAEEDRKDGGRDVVLIGRARGKLRELTRTGDALEAQIEVMKEIIDGDPVDGLTMTALRAMAARVVEIAWSESRAASRRSADAVTSAGRLADLILGYLELPIDEHQRWLEELDVPKRVAFVLTPPPGRELALRRFVQPSLMTRFWRALADFGT